MGGPKFAKIVIFVVSNPKVLDRCVVKNLRKLQTYFVYGLSHWQLSHDAVLKRPKKNQNIEKLAFQS